MNEGSRSRLNKLPRIVSVLGMLLVGSITAEAIREKIAYDRFSHKLENGTALLEPGVGRDRIRQLVGDPESTKLDDNAEFWYWAAADHQGLLWRQLGLTWHKGHYTLVVQLDHEGKLVGLWHGIN